MREGSRPHGVRHDPRRTSGYRPRRQAQRVLQVHEARGHHAERAGHLHAEQREVDDGGGGLRGDAVGGRGELGGQRGAEGRDDGVTGPYQQSVEFRVPEDAVPGLRRRGG